MRAVGALVMSAHRKVFARKASAAIDRHDDPTPAHLRQGFERKPGYRLTRSEDWSEVCTALACRDGTLHALPQSLGNGSTTNAAPAALNR